MTIQPNNLPWESNLLGMALEAFDHRSMPAIATMDSNLLIQAYQACEDITRSNSRTFFLASGLLPAEKRQAMRALYAFCRVSDDIVDRSLSADPRYDRRS